MIKNYIWVFILFIYIGFWKDDNFNGFGHLNNEIIENGAIDINNLESVGNKWISY